MLDLISLGPNKLFTYWYVLEVRRHASWHGTCLKSENEGKLLADHLMIDSGVK